MKRQKERKEKKRNAGKLIIDFTLERKKRDEIRRR